MWFLVFLKITLTNLLFHFPLRIRLRPIPYLWYMGEFELYFKLGLEHIADLQAYDHMVFLLALCALYQLSSWRKVAMLATAFTLGHSLTLALVALDILSISADLVETLIPITIIITAIFNLVNPSENLESTTFGKTMWRYYAIALGFGLIHGMGFSTYFSSLLGGEESIIFPLFAFNLGIEAGQLIIVLGILLTGYIAMDVLKMKQINWIHFVSGAAAGIATIILIG